SWHRASAVSVLEYCMPHVQHLLFDGEPRDAHAWVHRFVPCAMSLFVYACNHDIIKTNFPRAAVALALCLIFMLSKAPYAIEAAGVVVWPQSRFLQRY